MSAKPDVPVVKRSPVKLAEEAILAKDGSDSLPPSINLDPGFDADVSKTIRDSIMSSIKMNTLQTALKQSERMLKDEEIKLSGADGGSSRPVVSSHSSPQISPQMPLGIMQTGPGSDRPAIVKAILESLENDDARLAYIRDHPEMFSPSPIVPGGMSPSGMIQSSVQQSSPPLVESMAILTEAIKLGMSMQQAQQPQYTNSQPSALDPLKILETFREISDKTNSTFSNIVDQMRQQQVDQALKYQEILSNTQSKISEANERLASMQVDMINKDKEYLMTRLEEATAAASRPPGIQFDQVKTIIEQMQANNIPVRMSSADEERARAEIEIQKTRALHEIDLENRKLNLEEQREGRRSELIGAFATTVSGALGAQKLKNRQLSPAAANVVARF